MASPIPSGSPPPIHPRVEHYLGRAAADRVRSYVQDHFRELVNTRLVTNRESRIGFRLVFTGRRIVLCLCNRREQTRALGHGGGGRVYLAIDALTGELFGWKRAKKDPFFEQALESEAVLGKEASTSPHVLRTEAHIQYSKGEEQKNIVLLEFADQGSLGSALSDKQSSLSAKALRQLSSSMTLGLRDLHERDIIHSDINTRNILLVRGEAKLADFGASFRKGEEAPLAGSRRYFSPERTTLFDPTAVRPGSKTDDVWALGCVLYWMLFGSYGEDCRAWVKKARELRAQIKDLPEGEKVKDPRYLITRMLVISKEGRITAQEAAKLAEQIDWDAFVAKRDKITITQEKGDARFRRVSDLSDKEN